MREPRRCWTHVGVGPAVLDTAIWWGQDGCVKGAWREPGRRPTAYRAPSFTIVPRSYWALDILQEEGFRVDSSLFPVAHPRYGNPRGPRQPFRLGEPGNDLLVLPMTTLRVMGVNLPFSGGGYFRLFPAGLLHQHHAVGHTLLEFAFVVKRAAFSGGSNDHGTAA